MVVRPTESSDVTVTQTTKYTPPSSCSSSSNNMASSSFGAGDRRRTYKSQYGRISTYDPPSSRFKTGDSSRQSRYDSYSTTTSSTSSRARVSSSVDRDVDSLYKPFGRVSGLNVSGEDSRSLGRRAYSVDRDVSYDSSKVRPWREKLKMAEQKRRATERGELSSAVRRATSTDRGLNRSYSYESSTTTRSASPRRARQEVSATTSSYDAYLEGRSGGYQPPSRKSRAASLSRMGADRSYDYEGIIASAKKRAASVSRLEDDDYEVLPRRTAHTQAAAAAISGVSMGGRNMDVVEYNGDAASFDHRIRRGQDISSFVFRPGETFQPEHVNVTPLPSGRKATTYTTFSQYGHSDKREANNKINEVTLRTKLLEQSVSTLEEFVRRNRSYFPEETTIYQQIRFYQLDQEQLREIGESPDAEVYGVKVREKLVVPPGTDVAHILSRYYKKGDVDVEYSTGGGPVQDEVGGVARGRRVPLGDDYETYETTSSGDIQTTIRRQVEAEFDLRDKQRRVGQESFEARAATQRRQQHDEYTHLHPHLTPDYIHTVYRDAGATYDDIYQGRPGSGASSMTSPPASTSDLESIRSSASSRRRTYDQVPHFTAKLRNKQCISGQTIKFNCSVSGLPFPDISWFRGNRIIDQSGRITFSNNYGLLSLEITNVNKDDAGLYTVKAVNTEGEVACSASLDVIELDTGRGEGGASKPYFTVEAANTAAEIGGRAVFEARATGRPVPTFKWFRDNIPVLDSARTKMYEDAAGNSRLILSEVRPEDAGLYFLTAESKAGKAKCAATLRVVAERGLIGPDERRRSFSGEPLSRRRSWSRDTTPILDLPAARVKGTKPYFVQTPPVELKVREGEALTLKCMVDGDPKPVVCWARGTAVRQEQLAKVTWCKGVRELQYTERHRVVTEGDHYMMQIKQTTAYDRGQYIVVAENAVGRVHANCWVNVLPLGEPDEGADIEFKRFKLDLPEFELEALTKGELGKQAPMFVQRLPRERTVSAGSSLELHCHVREATPEVVTATTYQTKGKGKLELKEETIKIAADGTVTKKTEVVDLEGKPPRHPPPAAAAAAAAAPAPPPAAKVDSEGAAAAAPTAAPPSETEVAVPVVAMEPSPPKAEEEKKEVSMEVQEVQEEVVEAVVVEKAPRPPSPAKEVTPEVAKSPTPEKTPPAPEPAPREPTPPPVKEEVVEPVSAEKVKEVKAAAQEEEKPAAKEEPAPVAVMTETPAEAEVVAMEVESKPEPMEVVESKPTQEEPMEVVKEKAATPEPAKEEATAEVTIEAETKPSTDKAATEATLELPAETTSEETAEAATFELPAEKTSEETAEAATFELPAEKASEETAEAATFELPAEKTSEETAGAATFELPAETTSEETAEAATFELPAETTSDEAAGAATFELPAETTSEETAGAATFELPAETTSEETAGAATFELPAETEATKETRSASLSSLPEAPSSPTTKEAKSESEGGLPVFVEKMRNIMLPEGATATFSCALNDNSNATVKWTKDGDDLTSRTNVTVSADGCTHTVTVSNVSKADEGTYTCTATNANGNATCAATLTVETEAKPEEPVTAKEESKPADQETPAAEDTTKTSPSQQPQDSGESQDSESDSDSDSDSDSESESSSDSESDSEIIETQTVSKETYSKAAPYRRPSPCLSALSARHPRRSTVISVERHVSTDPLLETTWLCEGRQ